MWKHKTKWLVRGGRKVRCYLCGKKILAKGDLYLFDGDTGYYSHQYCMTESTTISGNERRRAVKKIAVGAAVVGAIAAGAGKFLDVSSQSKNSPAAQTILTSQGLILPALTSDPANPVPGQMWYRSDAGVEAHFDGVQNRVVYSSEINDGNVNVTSKGIVNGLSVLPNDGKGGFGPDTTKGTTAPGQYGSPYTETSGIQEGVNYVGTGINLPIVLSAGVFTISTSIVINYNGIRILGSGHGNGTSNNGVGTVLYTTTTGIDFIDLDEEDDNTDGWEIGNMRLVFNTTSTGSGINTINPVSNTNPFVHAYFHDLSVYNATTYAFQFTNFLNSRFEGLYSYNCNGTLSITSYGDDQDNAGNSTFITIKDVKSTSSATNPALNIDGSASSNNGGGVQMTTFIRVELEMVDTVETVNINNANSLTFINCDIDQQTSTTPTSCMVLNNVYQTSFINQTFSLVSNLSTGVSITDSENIFFDNPIVLGSGSKIGISPTNLAPHAIVIRGNFDQSTRANGGSISASGETAVKFEDFDYYNLTPSISVNPPVSGTVYQNLNSYDIRLKIPVTYNPTSTAAATLATGISQTTTVTTTTKVSIPSGLTAADGEILTYDIVVPAGLFYEIVVTNATIGTVEVQAA